MSQIYSIYFYTDKCICSSGFLNSIMVRSSGKKVCLYTKDTPEKHLMWKFDLNSSKIYSRYWNYNMYVLMYLSNVLEFSDIRCWYISQKKNTAKKIDLIFFLSVSVIRLLSTIIYSTFSSNLQQIFKRHHFHIKIIFTHNNVFCSNHWNIYKCINPIWIWKCNEETKFGSQKHHSKVWPNSFSIKKKQISSHIPKSVQRAPQKSLQIEKSLIPQICYWILYE